MTREEVLGLDDVVSRHNIYFIDKNDDSIFYDFILQDYYVTFERGDGYQINASFESINFISGIFYIRGIDHTGDWVEVELYPREQEEVRSSNKHEWWTNASREDIFEMRKKLNKYGNLLKNYEYQLENISKNDPNYNEYKRQYKIHEATYEKLKCEIEMAEINLTCRQFPKSKRTTSREERNRKIREKIDKEKQLTMELDELNNRYEILKKEYTNTKVGSVERKNCYDEVRNIMNQISDKKKELSSLRYDF